MRKLRFFEPRQYVSIDYARRDLLVIRMDSEGGGLPPELAAALASGKVDPGCWQFALRGQMSARAGRAGGKAERLRDPRRD